MKNQINDLFNYFDWRFWLVLLSLVCNTYLFFLNPALVESFSEQWLYAYLALARSIYSHQTEFYAESVLFPWLTMLLGASHHWLFYKILCSLLTLLILPAVAYFGSKYFNQSLRSWLLVVLFALSYRYLWRTYYLGYPDPLTIICLAGLALQRSPIVAFVFAVLATVSHLSISLLGLVGLSLLVITSQEQSKAIRMKFIGWVLGGLLFGRLLLEIWFYRFNYKLQNRFEWAMHHGLPAFTERYEANVSGFWLTPGWSFLIVYALTMLWFVIRRKFLFSGMMVICIAMSYLALFLTVDGLRVFATVICAPYVFILRSLIDDWLKVHSARRLALQANN